MIVSIVAALYLLFTTNMVHAAFAFLIVLLGVAVIFVFLNAEFVAIAQILIYVGGVLVLLLFGVMLTFTPLEKVKRKFFSKENLIYIFCGSIAFGLFFVLSSVNFVNAQEKKDLLDQNLRIPQKIGYFLMTEQIALFEISGLLLLVALIGAATIVGRK